MSRAECGTYAAYQQHRKRGEAACQACRAAGTAYMREYRARKAPGAIEAQTAGRATSRALWRLRQMHWADFELLFADEMRVERMAARRESS